MSPQVIIGPPGTGKTMRLLEVVEESIAKGTRPDHIAYLAFAKKAATEAIERATLKFGYSDKDLPYFRTLHSLAFRQLGLRRQQVVTWRDYRDLCDRLGIELLGVSEALDGDVYGMSPGDRLIYLEGMSRTTGRGLRQTWEAADDLDVEYVELERFARAFAEYKRTRGLLDFTDMLQGFVDSAAKTVPQLSLLVIDECQDLSALQWLAVRALASRSDRVVIAGDDLQAIFEWSGADIGQFLAITQGAKDTQVLTQSYRVPEAVHEFAFRISAQVTRKTKQVYLPRADRGLVNWYTDAEEVDLSKGSWLLLARNGYLLRQLEDQCMREGLSFQSVLRNPLQSDSLKAIISYTRWVRGEPQSKEDIERIFKCVSMGRVDHRPRSAMRQQPKSGRYTVAQLQEYGFPKATPPWFEFLDRVPPEERDYFLAARRRGETLTGAPRIKISTIHTAKGGEADKVLLLTDMSKRTADEMERNPDAEHRVWYVGATRARQELHLVQGSGKYFYEV